MQTIAIICAIVAALIGFGVGYASFAERSKGGAVLLGFLGAGLGALLGALIPYILIGIVLLVLGGYAFLQWFSEQ
jgi:hypothetical protein